jgi:hypothetical protein
METVARAFRVKSRKDIVELAKEVEQWPAEKKATFKSFFGDGHEQWFFQKIGGKPYVISVAEVARPEGYRDMATSDDEFTKWFRKRTKKITGVSLKKAPKGPPSELIFDFRL